MSAPELISYREYARRKGCDERVVREAIQRGYIVEAIVTPEGKKHPKINPEIADREWARHYNPNRTLNRKLAESLGVVADPENPAPAPAPKAAAPSPPPAAATGGDPLSSAGGPSIAKAKLKSEVHRAQLLELKVKQQSGELVKKADVYRELYSYGAEVKKALEAIPDRVVDMVLSASTRHEAKMIIAAEIETSLRRLTTLPKPSEV